MLEGKNEKGEENIAGWGDGIYEASRTKKKTVEVRKLH